MNGERYLRQKSIELQVNGRYRKTKRVTKSSTGCGEKEWGKAGNQPVKRPRKTTNITQKKNGETREGSVKGHNKKKIGRNGRGNMTKRAAVGPGSNLERAKNTKKEKKREHTIPLTNRSVVQSPGGH